MFTIEHSFDATVVTLLDEGEVPLREDVILRAHDDRITLEQIDPETGDVRMLTLSTGQIHDLAAALDLPEGIYRRRPARDGEDHTA